MVADTPRIELDVRRLYGAAPFPTTDDLASTAGPLEAARAELRRLQAAGEVGFASLDAAAWGLEGSREVAAQLRSVADHLVVLGIGGSALGARMVHSALRPDATDITVLDSIDPATVAPLLGRLDPQRTALLVVSKSGGTVETASLFRVFIPWLRDAVGDAWTRQVAFVTDPVGGSLRPLANELGIAALPVPPDVGGRFSVLTAVGLVPAFWLGVDVDALFAGAAAMLAREEAEGLDHPSWAFAAARELWWGQANITVLFAYCDRLRAFGEWFCQLWGESLGKPLPAGGHYGWTPVVAMGPVDQHSQLQLYQEGPLDKLITSVRVLEAGAEVSIPTSGGPERGVADYLAGRRLSELVEAERRGTMAALLDGGRPVMELRVPQVDAWHLGGLILMFELATALAGLVRGLNPFDQPGVEAGKKFASGLLNRPGFDEYAARADELLNG